MRYLNGYKEEGKRANAGWRSGRIDIHKRDSRLSQGSWIVVAVVVIAMGGGRKSVRETIAMMTGFYSPSWRTG